VSQALCPRRAFEVWLQEDTLRHRAAGERLERELLESARLKAERFFVGEVLALQVGP